MSAEPSMPTRVLIVDDHEVVRQGVRAMLESAGMKVIGEAGDGETAVDLARSQRPDVVVLDVRLGDDNGIEVCREIRSEVPSLRVVMLTSFADEEALFSAIMAGASAFVLKEVKGGDLVGAVKAVAEGKSLLDPSMTEAVLDKLRQTKDLLKDEKLGRLSPQEERILTRVAEGRTNREIGDELRLAEKTVKNYVSSILMKLEVVRRAEAAAYLERHRRRQ